MQNCRLRSHPGRLEALVVLRASRVGVRHLQVAEALDPGAPRNREVVLLAGGEVLVEPRVVGAVVGSAEFREQWDSPGEKILVPEQENWWFECSTRLPVLGSSS